MKKGLNAKKHSGVLKLKGNPLSIQKKMRKGRKDILKFAGAFDKTELRRMKIAIKNGCENIDSSEW